MRRNSLPIKIYRFFKQQVKLGLFYLNGRRPWTKGYFEYKWSKIKGAVNNPQIMNLFADSSPLPTGYGLGVDERVIEYPWAMSRLLQNGSLLDAGSALNFETILKHPALSHKEITIVNLVRETNNFSDLGVRYIYADIRKLPFDNDHFDSITCISTLEHIGMDNSIYDKGSASTSSGGDYLSAVKELKRVLKPQGQLLITVPFGRRENHGFFQQFDSQMTQNVVAVFNGRESKIDFYKYSDRGWQLSSQFDCEDVQYYNVRAEKKPAPDKAAAARAVACITLIK